MGRLYFRTIRVVMWSAAETEPYQRYDAPAAILIRPLGKIYPPPAQIKHELFAPIYRGQWNRHPAAETGVVPLPFIHSAFLQRDERTRFCLG